MSSGSAISSQQQLAAAPRAGADAAAELARFLEGLLELQCALSGALAGVVYLAGTPQRRAGLAARWPLPGSSEALVEIFQPEVLKSLEALGRGACEHAGERAAPLSPRLDPLSIGRGDGLYGSGATHRALTTPLAAGGRIEGATVLVLPPGSSGSAEEALERVALTNARFEAFLWKQQALTEAHQRALLRETLELLDASQQGTDARSMGALMCHELQRRFGCSRVSIGLVGGAASRVRMVAISGSEDLDRKGPAAESLENAMEECALQDIEVVYPARGDEDDQTTRVVRAHEQLSQRFGPSAIVSLPLRVEGDLVGVVVMERSADDPFPPGSIPLLRLVSEFIGPSLWTRRLADRGVLAVSRDRVRVAGRMLVGPRYTGAKLLGLFLLLLSLAAAFVPIPSRVTADAEVKAAVSRTIVPPFTGHLDAVLVRPGSVVEAGQVLARMDTAELSLQREELLARRSRQRTEIDAARTQGNAAQAEVVAAQIRETDAQIELLEDRLSRAEIRSPIAGTISRGDLEDFVGARIDPTQPLFEIVTGDRVVVLEVEETDIGRVEVGQRGALSSRARPEDRVPIEVLRINPVAEAVRGANVYLVEASIVPGASGVPEWLRPGETGVAKLEAGSTTTLSALMGPIADELRLRLWW